MTWQPAAIEYPDAELLMCTRTRTLLDDSTVYVGNRVPTTRRPKMVIWNRDGGGSSSLRDQPHMRCRVWAETDQAAIDLARQLIAGLPTLRDGAPILQVVHESGPYDVPDESEQVQKYLLFTIHTRGVVPA